MPRPQRAGISPIRVSAGRDSVAANMRSTSLNNRQHGHQHRQQDAQHQRRHLAADHLPQPAPRTSSRAGAAPTARPSEAGDPRQYPLALAIRSSAHLPTHRGPAIGPLTGTTARCRGLPEITNEVQPLHGVLRWEPDALGSLSKTAAVLPALIVARKQA